jgi:hypothetical protein
VVVWPAVIELGLNAFDSPAPVCTAIVPQMLEAFVTF